jgi:hypothetical protein
MQLGLLRPCCSSSTQVAPSNSRAPSAAWRTVRTSSAKIAARAKKDEAVEYDLVTKMVGKLFGKAVVGEWVRAQAAPWGTGQ